MDELKFNVKNLGSIYSGEFEHKPLTIFCGANNSGKTWTMYSLYSFYTFMSGRVIRFKNTESLLDKESFDINTWLEENHEDIVKQYNLIISKSLPDFFNCSPEILEDSSLIASITIDEIVKCIPKSKIEERLPKILITKAKNSNQVQIIDDSADEDTKREVLNRFLSKCLFNFTDTFLMPAERNGLHLVVNQSLVLLTKSAKLKFMILKRKINIKMFSLAKCKTENKVLSTALLSIY